MFKTLIFDCESPEPSVFAQKFLDREAGCSDMSNTDEEEDSVDLFDRSFIDDSEPNTSNQMSFYRNSNSDQLFQERERNYQALITHVMNKNESELEGMGLSFSITTIADFISELKLDLQLC